MEATTDEFPAIVVGPDDGGAHAPPPERRSRWHTTGRWAARVAIAICGLLVVYVGVTFVQVWRASRANNSRPSDAIVVLGAAQYDGRPSPAFKARLDRAYDLYRAGVAPRIVTTGANQPGDRFTEGHAGMEYLRGRGVPDADIVVIDRGTDTYQELSATAQQLGARGQTAVVLVSDGYHAFRLEQTAGEVGLRAVVARTRGSATFSELTRETAAVSLGRVIGYRRLATLG